MRDYEIILIVLGLMVIAGGITLIVFLVAYEGLVAGLFFLAVFVVIGALILFINMV